MSFELPRYCNTVEKFHCPENDLARNSKLEKKKKKKRKNTSEICQASEQEDIKSESVQRLIHYTRSSGH